LTERLSSDPTMALHARAHQEIIRKYGRFPTRNAALGRESTPKSRPIWIRAAIWRWSTRCAKSHAPDA
jgi:uncharacterized protein (DUF924 family)